MGTNKKILDISKDADYLLKGYINNKNKEYEIKRRIQERDNKKG